ncbi:hypothetical protein P2318_20375 [Myxococcaceae bacterium GXIMD 01537]
MAEHRRRGVPSKMDIAGGIHGDRGREVIGQGSELVAAEILLSTPLMAM